jgi:hypothetical protein
MASKDTAQRPPCCLECGHEFRADEIAAMTTKEGEEDLCIIDCASCGAHNVARAAPRAGFENQPAVTVLRTVPKDPQAADVFDETVEPGVRVHPITSGSSN